MSGRRAPPWAAMTALRWPRSGDPGRSGDPPPRLEVVLTTDEEIGMLGAERPGRRASSGGRKLINVDSEEEGSSPSAAQAEAWPSALCP